MSYQERTFPSYNINTISSRQLMRVEKDINLGIISWSPISNISRSVWQTVRAITDDILGVKMLKYNH